MLTFFFMVSLKNKPLRRLRISNPAFAMQSYLRPRLCVLRMLLRSVSIVDSQMLYDPVIDFILGSQYPTRHIQVQFIY